MSIMNDINRECRELAELEIVKFTFKCFAALFCVHVFMSFVWVDITGFIISLVVYEFATRLGW